MRVLTIDKFDSFTHNPVHYPGLEAGTLVRRSYEASLKELLKLHPDRIAVSPGPRTPNGAAISLAEVVQKAPERVPTEAGRALLEVFPEV